MRQELLMDIDRIIKQAALDGVLTEDAIEYYNGLIKVAEEKSKELDDTKVMLEAERKLVGKLERELSTANELVKIAGQREAELIGREAECLKHELTAANANSRLQDHKDMMALIFKPGEIRREAWKSIPGFDENGYPNCNTGNQNETENLHDE